MDMISFGANFIKVYDEDGEVYLTFKCKEDSVLNDRVIELVRELAREFIDCSDVESLYALYREGWYIYSIE